MKRSALFLFALFILNSAFAQFDSVQVLHRYYYSDYLSMPYGLHDRNENHFDSLRRLLSTEHDTWDSVKFNKSDKETYSFDSAGNQTEHLWQTWNGQQWKNNNVEWKYWNSFQKTDSLIQATNQNDTAWLINSIHRFGYNANGDMIFSEPDSSYRTFIFPDANGNETLSLGQTYNGVSWNNADSTLMFYNSNGKTILTKDYYFNTGSWQMLDSIVMTYYLNDSLFINKRFNFNSGGSILISIDSSVYQNDTTFRYSGSDSLGTIVYNYRALFFNPESQYNNYSTSQELINGNWQVIDYSSCVYDSTNNVAYQTGSTAGSSAQTTFIFNSDSHLMKDSYNSTTHSGFSTYGDTYYYYYLTEGLIGICTNENVTLFVRPGMNSYLWNTGDTIDSITSIIAGEYYCDIVNLWGFQYRSEPHFVISAPNPYINLGVDTILCINSQLLLDAGNFISYQWNNGSNDSILNIQSSVPDTQVVSVLVMDNYGCSSSDTISIIIAVCTGFQTVPLADLSVYPNPSTSHITISLVEQSPVTEITITNAFGQVVSRARYSNSSKLEFDLMGESGLYFVRVVAGEKSGVYKVVKMEN